MRLAMAMSALLVPGIAGAHPDHAAGGDFGIVHFVTDPFHVGLTVALVLLLLAVGGRFQRRASADRPRR